MRQIQYLSTDNYSHDQRETISPIRGESSDGEHSHSEPVEDSADSQALGQTQSQTQSGGRESPKPFSGVDATSQTKSSPDPNQKTLGPNSTNMVSVTMLHPTSSSVASSSSSSSSPNAQENKRRSASTINGDSTAEKRMKSGKGGSENKEKFLPAAASSSSQSNKNRAKANSISKSYEPRAGFVQASQQSPVKPFASLSFIPNDNQSIGPSSVPPVIPEFKSTPSSFFADMTVNSSSAAAPNTSTTSSSSTAITNAAKKTRTKPSSDGSTEPQETYAAAKKQITILDKWKDTYPPLPLLLQLILSHVHGVNFAQVYKSFFIPYGYGSFTFLSSDMRSAELLEEMPDDEIQLLLEHGQFEPRSKQASSSEGVSSSPEIFEDPSRELPTIVPEQSNLQYVQLHPDLRNEGIQFTHRRTQCFLLMWIKRKGRSNLTNKLLIRLKLQGLNQWVQGVAVVRPSMDDLFQPRQKAKFLFFFPQVHAFLRLTFQSRWLDQEEANATGKSPRYCADRAQQGRPGSGVCLKTNRIDVAKTVLHEMIAESTVPIIDSDLRIQQSKSGYHETFDAVEVGLLCSHPESDPVVTVVSPSAPKAADAAEENDEEARGAAADAASSSAVNVNDGIQPMEIDGQDEDQQLTADSDATLNHISHIN